MNVAETVTNGFYQKIKKLIFTRMKKRYFYTRWRYLPNSNHMEVDYDYNQYMIDWLTSLGFTGDDDSKIQEYMSATLGDINGEHIFGIDSTEDNFDI